MRILFLLFTAVLLPALTGAQNEKLVFQSGPARVSFVELFTSEGCSSCPPAEKWLGGLKNNPGLWKKFVPVAFHVDYWDRLGWKDKLARPQFTSRQYAYSNEWAKQNVYTPNFVLNGKEWRGWYGRPDLPLPTGELTGILEVEFVGENIIDIKFTPQENISGRIFAHAAYLVMDSPSQVTSGENKGKRLVQDFAAVNLISEELEKLNPGYKGKINLKGESFIDFKPKALVVWITERNSMVPLQVVGGYLGH